MGRAPHGRRVGAGLRRDGLLHLTTTPNASAEPPNATALLIYRLFGGFGPFHVAALLSLVSVAGGVLPAVRRRPADRRVEQHYWWMTLSYVGLLAATASEVVTRLPGTVFWWAVLLASAAVLAVGAVLVARRAQAALEPSRRMPEGRVPHLADQRNARPVAGPAGAALDSTTPGIAAPASAPPISRQRGRGPRAALRRGRRTTGGGTPVTSSTSSSSREG